MPRIDNDASKDRDADKDKEVAGKEGEIPDFDIEEEGLDGQFEEISNDPTDLELPDEDPKIPEGYEISECPDEKKLKKMSGERIMFKWDCGWAMGVVKNKHSKSDLYNYFVQYTEPDGEKYQFRQGLFLNGYHDENNNPNGWIWLKKTKA